MNKKSLAPLSIIILSGALFSLLVIIGGTAVSHQKYALEKERHEKYFEKIIFTDQREPATEIPSDIINWKTYKNTKYEFEIKYPANWNVPQEKTANDEKLGYELKISFRNNPKITEKKLPSREAIAPRDYSQKPKGNSNGYTRYAEDRNKIIPRISKDSYLYEEKMKGFDILVYSSKKSSTNNRTNSNHELSLGTPYDFDKAPGNTVSGCSLNKVSGIKNDFYLEKAYFYDISHDKYALRIVPFYDEKNGARIESENIFPEFFQSLLSFGFRKEPLIILNPSKKPVMVKRGPMPYVFDVVAGRRVCNKKNDKPKKSKQNKRGHMDMECCLDPDEIPNPNCYYPPSKYGSLLSKAGKK